MDAALKIWIFLAVTCLGMGSFHKGSVPYSTSDGEVIEANSDFAFQLYKKLAARPDSAGKNVFFSPASVSLALAALATGARGETHQQLFSGLELDHLEQALVDQAFQGLLTKKSEVVKQGTALFVDKKFKARPEFLEGLRQHYAADGFNVSFARSVETINFINSYVARNTNGKINKLVESLDPRTIMYLVSYIYFKGMWETPFDPKATTKDKFTVAKNKEVDVDMMHMEENVDVFDDPEVKTSVLSLPFNSSHAMLLMLPDDMSMLENAISPERIDEWLACMASRKFKVYVPKFSIKTSYSLKDTLEQMGMTAMFTNRADLSGIAKGQLSVSQVVHQATLDVDETGATAAAATGVGISLTSFIPVPVLKFNRPFMVVITEGQTILFLGKIVDPTI